MKMGWWNWSRFAPFNAPRRMLRPGLLSTGTLSSAPWKYNQHLYKCSIANQEYTQNGEAIDLNIGPDTFCQLSTLSPFSFPTTKETLARVYKQDCAIKWPPAKHQKAEACKHWGLHRIGSSSSSCWRPQTRWALFSLSHFWIFAANFRQLHLTICFKANVKVWLDQQSQVKVKVKVKQVLSSMTSFNAALFRGQLWNFLTFQRPKKNIQAWVTESRHIIDCPLNIWIKLTKMKIKNKNKDKKM